MKYANTKTMPSFYAWLNIWFVIGKTWKWNRTLLFLSALRVPALVFLPFFGVLLPKQVIGCLSAHASLRDLVSTVGLTTLGIAVCGMASAYLEGRIKYEATSVRMHFLSLFAQKTLDTDYENLESQEGQKVRQKAMDASSGIGSGTQTIWPELVLLAANAFGVLLYGSVLSLLNPLLLAFLVAASAASFFASRSAQQYEHRHKDYWAPIERKLWYLIEKCGDFVASKDIRLYEMTGWFDRLFAQLLGQRMTWERRVETRQYGAQIVDALMAFVRDGISYAYLIALVLQGRLSVANFVLYFGLVAGFSAWLSGIAGGLTRLYHISLELCDARDYLDFPDQSNRKPGEPLPSKKEWPCSITFEHVFFRYPGADHDVISDFNITIRPGEKIALVGVNGAGKTTCVKLLCGFYRPTAGRVLLNGVDIAAFNRDDYFRLFTAVFQDIHMLPLSIAENIAPDAAFSLDRERLWTCVRLSGLEKKIRALPQGLETPLVREVNEDATQFSGGELQKLLLARALYKDAPILLLDEPTAALDPIAEDEVYRQYCEITKGKTSVFISHRLSSTRFCDRILFLQNGRIAECGTHDALMQQNGNYAKMFQLQSRYYRQQPHEDRGDEENAF